MEILTTALNRSFSGLTKVLVLQTRKYARYVFKNSSHYNEIHDHTNLLTLNFEVMLSYFKPRNFQKGAVIAHIIGSFNHT